MKIFLTAVIMFMTTLFSACDNPVSKVTDNTSGTTLELARIEIKEPAGIILGSKPAKIGDQVTIKMADGSAYSHYRNNKLLPLVAETQLVEGDEVKVVRYVRLSKHGFGKVYKIGVIKKDTATEESFKKIEAESKEKSQK